MQGQLDESQKVDAGCVCADDGSNVDPCWINLQKQKQRVCTDPRTTVS